MAWADGRTIHALADLVTGTYGWRCWLCSEPISPLVSRRHRRGLSIDHQVPRSKGGTDAIENLRPAHLGCNSRRGNRPPAPPPARTPVEAPGFFRPYPHADPALRRDSLSNRPEKSQETRK